MLPAPVALWDERPDVAARPVARLYWYYDAATDSWTLTSNRALENGQLADAGDGSFQLFLLPALPVGAGRMAVARRNNTDVLVYH